MVKKSGGKKVPVKAKGRSGKKKVGAIPVSDIKAGINKERSRKVALKVQEGKAHVMKKSRGGPIKKKRVEKSKKAEGMQKPASKGAAPKKGIKKTPSTTSRPASGITEAARKESKPLKTKKGKSTTRGVLKEKTKRIKKTAKKAAEKPQKKAAVKRTVKAKTLEPTKPPRRKGVAERAKKKERVTVKGPERIEEKKAAGESPTAKEITRLPYILTPDEALPSEYGENEVMLMTVDPNRLFAFWEVRKELLNIFEGVLNLRVYDVTGIDLDVTDAHSFYDSTVPERIGKAYLAVSPSKEYIADIGILYSGIFIGIARSPRVHTPVAYVPGEEEFLPKYLDAGTPAGY